MVVLTKVLTIVTLVTRMGRSSGLTRRKLIAASTLTKDAQRRSLSIAWQGMTTGWLDGRNSRRTGAAPTSELLVTSTTMYYMQTLDHLPGSQLTCCSSSAARVWMIRRSCGLTRRSDSATTSFIIVRTTFASSEHGMVRRGLGAARTRALLVMSGGAMDTDIGMLPRNSRR